MLLPCLEHTVAAHQPLAKPYSTVVTVAVCLHESGEPSSTTATTAWWGSPIFHIDCIHWIIPQKKDWDPLKRILNCITWEGNMCESCCIEIIGPKGVWCKFDANLTQWWHDTEMPSWCSVLKQLDSKRHGYAIMGGVVLGINLSGPSCCLSAECQKRLHGM